MSSTPTRRDAIARGWKGALGVVLGLGLGASAPIACTLELDPSLACGDGYVDESAGEECDPGDPDSFMNACAGTLRPEGFGQCDPVSCQIINDLDTCARCGDGIVDPGVGEECDGDEFFGSACPAGGTIQCTPGCRLDYSACERCGNGVLDPGEECDPEAVEILTMGKPDCTELVSPMPHKPYASGQPGRCMDDCRWERAGCSYCGDGSLDEDPRAVDPEGNFMTLPEICDGSDFQPEALEDMVAGSGCGAIDENARLIVECSDDCLEIIPRFDLAQPCCLETYAACPSPGETLRCCFEVENPQTAEPCGPFYNPDGVYSFGCK